MEEALPPGFRFHPTDEELITYYLNQKISDAAFTSKAIAVVDLNKNEPWDLPAKASMGEKEWYFYSVRDRKYPTGLRTNRATEAGYWKTTGKDKEIFCGGTAAVLVGMKKTLVFYKGRAPRGEKSNWVMHEYRRENKHVFKPSKEEWVVCRVFQKNNTPKKPQQTSSSQPSFDSPCDTNSIANEFGDIELPNINTLANSSSAFSNISAQTYDTDNMNMSMNMNMNWAAAAANETASPSTLQSLPWPASTFLGSNLSVNSLLLKALQLRNYQQREVLGSSGYTNYIPQGNVNSQFGSDHLSFQASSSSSKILDTSPQQQQEQPLNLDSIW